MVVLPIGSHLLPLLPPLASYIPAAPFLVFFFVSKCPSPECPSPDHLPASDWKAQPFFGKAFPDIHPQVWHFPSNSPGYLERASGLAFYTHCVQLLRESQLSPANDELLDSTGNTEFTFPWSRKRWNRSARHTVGSWKCMLIGKPNP